MTVSGPVSWIIKSTVDAGDTDTMGSIVSAEPRQKSFARGVLSATVPSEEGSPMSTGRDSSRIPVPEPLLILSPPLLLARPLLAATPSVPTGSVFISRRLRIGDRVDETDSWTEGSRESGVEESRDMARLVTGAPTYPGICS